MKQITAIVKPFKLEEVREGLAECGVTGLTVLLWRLLYNLWLLGAFLLISAVSREVFSRERFKRKLNRMTYSVPLALVWPVSLFSPPGRRVLLKRISQL